ncbi:hypothetical protein AB0953_16405 [Streptomyces sp. NPDC046866]|uniref:hypothetical protein n=1 Tax=Streptomyces sp. NPDC046866 TaxID=3154921 RepID=UPI003455C8CA
MTTPPTNPPAPARTKPEGIILVKGQPEQGDGKAVFGIWPSGYCRRITAAEYTLWGFPEIDYWIPANRDDEYNQLHAYDAALRG